MLTPEHFEISPEREFLLLKVKQEINECDDVKVLREHLKELVDQNAKYQHLISKLLEEQIKKDFNDFVDYIKEQANEQRSN